MTCHVFNMNNPFPQKKKKIHQELKATVETSA